MATHISRGEMGIKVSVVSDIPTDAEERIEDPNKPGKFIMRAHPHRGMVTYDYGNGTMRRIPKAEFNRIYRSLNYAQA